MPEIAWKKIVCPVDLSEDARAALEVAADLARRFGAELVLLHVDEDGAGGAAAQLAALEAEARRAGAARVAAVVTRGHPKSAISQYADANGVDLVVMGTHGRTGRAHALVGSVAENTVRTAKTPVLVVPPRG